MLKLQPHWACKATLIVGVVFSLLGLNACSDDNDFTRSKNILVFDDPATCEASSSVICNVNGGVDTLWIRSNVEYQMTFRTSDDNKSWVQFEDKGYDATHKAQMFLVTYAPVESGTYVLRTGTLSVVYPDDYLGQFVVFKQGFSTRLADKFDWLNTGTDVPYDTTGEKLFSSWTTAQQSVGWTSPLLDTLATTAYLYSKKGYVKLGDGVHAAQLQTPDLNKMVADSIVILSFKAVAYTAEDGTKDNNTLTVRIENGGTFADGTTTRTLELPYYDPAATDLTTSMWTSCTFNLPVVTDATEVFTDKTAFVFSTSNGQNRVFLDDIYVYIVDAKSLYILDTLK